ncbi:MAG TPA: YceI family protein [Longimicrobium sp.]|nr:YceI family protein [Longimicrobium sp.]
MRKRIYLGAVLAAAPLLIAAAATNLSFQPGSRVWVQGTSTVRGWRCESTAVEGSAQAAGTELSALASVGGATLTIPVASLDCRNQTMNGHLRKALKADEAPAIRLRATSVRVAADGSAKLDGELTIAGSTQPVSIDATVSSEDGQVRVRGQEALVMTAYDVRPPSLMMGTMRVNPNVTVGFDVVLKP